MSLFCLGLFHSHPKTMVGFYHREGKISSSKRVTRFWGLRFCFRRCWYKIKTLVPYFFFNCGVNILSSLVGETGRGGGGGGSTDIRQKWSVPWGSILPDSRLDHLHCRKSSLCCSLFWLSYAYEYALLSFFSSLIVIVLRFLYLGIEVT